MKKRTLIITTALLVVIALVAVCGVSFAAWNINSKDTNFSVAIGKNVELKVTFDNFNSTLEGGENTYTGTEEGETACDDMILIPDGAISATDPNNAYNVLFGTFVVEEFGNWEPANLKATFALSEIKLTGPDNTFVDASTLFTIKVLAATDVAVNNDYVSKSVPNVTNTPLVADTTELVLKDTYYVFVSFTGNNTTVTPADFVNKALSIKLTINASVKA